MAKKKTTLKDARPDWDDYFLEIASIVAKRATCLRRKVGAVVVKNRRILCTGYNGTPTGITHCITAGCLRQQLKVPSGERHELCRGLHAEQNALLQASYYGIPIEGSTIYITNQPCSICAKMLINAGIKEVVVSEGYPDKLALDFLNEAQIRLRRVR